MDFERYANSKIYAFFDVLYKLMVINILWFFSTIIGFGILTLFPATVSLFILIHSIIKEKEFPLIKSFWAVFKKEYFRAQKVFLIFGLISIVFYFNLRIYYEQIINQANFISSIGFWITILLIFLFLLTLTQLFFMFLYFPDFKLFKTIKYAFLFALAFPFRSILILLIMGIGLILLMVFQILIPLSFLLLISMITYLSIKIMTPKYAKILKEKEALTIYDYID